MIGKVWKEQQICTSLTTAKPTIQSDSLCKCYHSSRIPIKGLASEKFDRAAWFVQIMQVAESAIYLLVRIRI